MPRRRQPANALQRDGAERDGGGIAIGNSLRHRDDEAARNADEFRMVRALRTGAGDAFASTATAAILLGKTVPEALTWGPINSAFVVQKIGAQEGLLGRPALEEKLKNAPANYKAVPL